MKNIGIIIRYIKIIVTLITLLSIILISLFNSIDTQSEDYTKNEDIYLIHEEINPYEKTI